MRDGFTFCDVDIADIGLHYVPELQDTYVYNPAETETHFETSEGHDGGHFYGAWKNPKDFILRCYFENSRIDKGIMSRVNQLFRPGRTGKLVFQKRPWCYYVATVNAKPQLDILNYENGLVTIGMTATYPFARSDILFRELYRENAPEVSEYRDNMMANTAVFESEDMLPPMNFEHKTAEFPAILGNPGTERAQLGVYISGDAEAGLKITNTTTKQTMELTGITKALTTDVNKKLYVDSLSGKTILKGSTSELAFRYHVAGFLELEPAYPAYREIFINYVPGNVVTTPGFFADNLKGLYIFVEGKWRKINSQPDRQTLELTSNMSGSGSEKTMIMSMNELIIEPKDTMDIDLSFVFKPTYS